MASAFEDALVKSHSVSNRPYWEKAYRIAFPNMLSMQSYPKNGEHQAAGIDRSIHLDNGAIYFIDEKARFKHYTTAGHTDIALEFVSNSKTKALGWVEKPLRAHYIAYAIEDISMVFLLPVPQLQLAWKRNQSAWKKSFGERRTFTYAKGTTDILYATYFCCVPVPILFGEMGSCLRINYSEAKTIAAE